MNNQTPNISEIEVEIIKMIAKEMPNKLIAHELNYSQRMIEYYISKVTKKLKVQTRVGIVSKAYQMKILSPDSLDPTNENGTDYTFQLYKNAK
ncbi:response regulator transcription factor [Priestia taiwanensis]|uniref:HTH luxR-type domain-containing protein n=1 Tax=Priestia taiwanensis TaxID=1347902 RepID=A0A917AYB8_9BACI|nr:LuxR C-terminal-related transcriptional regulator [Priestia taiwanensis]MBM7365063.1 DNA-binding NarL/FixJ family response regulator [Priestia taiwanensis]GGE83788.1 hypothetical protein GCM10007140_36620 [Priestia taiwanensis]